MQYDISIHPAQALLSALARKHAASLDVALALLGQDADPAAARTQLEQLKRDLAADLSILSARLLLAERAV
jgi:hypothetical protein